MTERIFRAKHGVVRARNVRDLLGVALRARAPERVESAIGEDKHTEPQRLTVRMRDGSQYLIQVSEVVGPRAEEDAKE